MTPDTADFKVSPMDSAFRAALQGRPYDWAVRAIAGYTMRQFCAGKVELDIANRHGLSRCHSPEEIEAWTFGFTWINQAS